MRSIRPVTALLFLSCAPQGDPRADGSAPQQGGTTDARWMQEVSARIRDASHAFAVDADGFVTAVPEQGTTGRFDGDGAHLAVRDDVISVRTTGFGRGDGEATIPVAPGLGACVDDMVEPGGDCVRRLEYIGADVTEWWTSRPDGLEQGWTVAVRPAGEGALSLDLTVEGAEVTVGEGEVSLQGDGGGLLMVEGLAAFDADGVVLEARFEPTAEGFRVRVEDAEARYPVEIDPVYTTASWAVEGSGETDFASALSDAGDVNGDGYDDVMVGSPGAGSAVGKAYLYLGASGGLSSFSATTMSGEAAGSQFGGAVSAAGDVNADGYDDVLVGAYGYDTSTGRAYLFLGSPSGLSGSASSTMNGETTSSFFGESVSAAGDVNGDGHDDVIVGAYGYNSSSGRAYLYLGSATGVSTSAAATLTGELLATARFGDSVSAAGDVNGDGYDDVIVGAPGYNYGRAYIYQGSAGGLSTVVSTRLTYTMSASFGRSVSGAGDVNRDGYDDVIVGTGYYGNCFAYVYHGAASGLSTVASTTLTGGTYSYFGYWVSGGGDVNGDGYDDVVVGAPGSSESGGWASVYHGSSTGIGSVAAVTLATNDYVDGVHLAGDVNGDGFEDLLVSDYATATPDDRVGVYLGSSGGAGSTASTTLSADTPSELGYSVSGAGDVNADGFGDVIVGAPGYGSSTGRAYVFDGTSSGLSSVASATLSGQTIADAFGSSVSTAGDVNADGYDDVIVGAPSYRSGRGRAYVYLGSSSGVSSSPVAPLTGATTTNYFGASVSNVGDVNGDGYDDVIVGAYGYSSLTGRAYIFQGAASGLSSTASTTLTGQTIANSFGYSVSGAGDVNGDGYDDAIVGAYGYNASVGRAYVYPGAASGLASTASTVLSGAAYGYFGYSVSGAGDVNGDGYDDVIVGAYLYGAGKAYVYQGSSGGVSSVPSTTLSGEATAYHFGDSVSGAGDVNGDGYDDIVVGAQQYSSFNGTGRTYLHHGSSTGVSGTAATVLTGEASSNDFGHSVSGAGDVNGDGYDDVIVGAYGYDGDVGKAYLFAGYADADADGVASTSDCDDTDASIGAATTWYADTDADGYGSSLSSTACDQPSGYVADASDCDDTNAAVSPAASEICDLADTDEDCDGLADDDDASVTGVSLFYADADGDGYGSLTSLTACDLPTGYATDATDCNDASAAISPGADEACNDLDDNCDGVADEGVPYPAAWYLDADGDGYGTGIAFTPNDCAAPTGYAWDNGDCNESDATVHPNAVDPDADGIDQDCSDPYNASILVADGAVWTVGGSLNVALSATDNGGVIDMCLSTTTTCATWQTYATSATFNVGTAAGAVTVYAWFRDGDGNVSAQISDGISVDNTAPTDGTVTSTTGDTTLALAWSGFSDATSGVATYSVRRSATSTPPASCAAGAEVYSGTTTATTISGLTSGTTYGFRVCATDAAGNTSAGARASVRVGSPPTGTVSINSGAVWTRSPVVTLALPATDDTAVTEMCLSTTTTCTVFTPYATTQAWTLGGAGTTRTVYATFRDAAGNQSLRVSDTIQLDRAAPTPGTLTATSTAPRRVALAWSGFTDTVSGIASYTVVRSAANGATPANCATGSVVYSGVATSAGLSSLNSGSTYGFRVCATDAAGNVDAGASAAVVVQ